MENASSDTGAGGVSPAKFMRLRGWSTRSLGHKKRSSMSTDDRLHYFIEMISKEGVAALTAKLEQPSQEIRFDIELARQAEVPKSFSSASMQWI